MSHEISLNNLIPMNNGNTDPQQSPPPPTGYPPANPPISSPQTNNDDALQRRRSMKSNWFEDMRGWIMVVAVLVASVTYTTGLNPPGGFWQDDLDGHKAGFPILPDKLKARYSIFFNANGTAFMASLIIIILLMNENFYTNRARVAMLHISMVLALVSMIIAYVAGCARNLKASSYVTVVAGAVLLFGILSSSLLPSICILAKDCVPGVDRVVGRGIFNPHSQKEGEGHNNMTKSSSISN